MISKEFPEVSLFIILILVEILVMMIIIDFISLISSENCRIFKSVVNSGSFKKYS